MRSTEKIPKNSGHGGANFRRGRARLGHGRKMDGAADRRGPPGGESERRGARERASSWASASRGRVRTEGGGAGLERNGS